MQAKSWAVIDHPQIGEEGNADVTKNVDEKKSDVAEDPEANPDPDHAIVLSVTADLAQDPDHLQKSRKKRKKLGIVNVKNCGKKNRNAKLDWPWRPN